MTNEEAISALKNTAWIGTDKKVGEVEKAIMMAIEALKAQDVPDTNVGNNDLISRSDAIDAVDKLSDEPIGYLEAAIDALVDLPSAQPVVKDTNVPNNDDIISRHAVIDRAVTIPMFGRDVKMVAVSEIKNLPSAQPEIIRCKDCKHRDPEDKKCDCGHGITWQLPRPDEWFCADAERRTDE